MSATSVIFCQSLINALTVWCAGYRNVSALLGLQAEVCKDEVRSTSATGATAARAWARTPASSSLRCFERCGVVGEESNELVGYLAAVIRMLDDPLALIVLSMSAAGKMSVMAGVLVLEEVRVKYSAVTGLRWNT